MAKQKGNKREVLIRVYAEDANILAELKTATEVTQTIGLPYVRPKIGHAVHYLVSTARCPECSRLLPRGRCESCDQAGM